MTTHDKFISPQDYLKQLAGSDYELLYKIAVCESGFKSVKNKNSSASGIFQFIASTWSKWGQGDIMDDYNNINAAVDLFHAEGTRPWESSYQCWSKD